MSELRTYNIVHDGELLTVKGIVHGPFAVRMALRHYVIDHLPSGLNLWRGPNPILHTPGDAMKAINKLNSMRALWDCQTIEGIALSAGLTPKQFADKATATIRGIRNE